MGQMGRDLVKINAADRDGNEYEMALAAGDRVRLFNSARAEGERGQHRPQRLDPDRAGGRSATAYGCVTPRARGLHRLEVADQGRSGSAGLRRSARRRTRRKARQSTEHIYAMPAGTKTVNGFSAYSSGTRHEQKSFMIISDGAERARCSTAVRSTIRRPIHEEDVWANVGRNLSRQPVKATAT